LLVDDEDNILSALERLFVRGGYHVLTANSGRAGLALLEEHHVGVIISDQRMPGMTGVEFLSKVKLLYPNVMRLMLSGFADLKSVTTAINEGDIYRFLTKPCDNGLLLRNVGEAFRHFEIKRENERLYIELQASNRELEDAFNAAERKSQAKSKFIATMSHEFRSPLNGVLGMAQLLRNTSLDEEQREDLDIILSSGNQLLTLVNDILDDAKAEAGKLELESIDFDLRDMLENTAMLLGAQARNKGLELITDFSFQMNPVLRGDPTRLRQVLTNLIGNAIKFTSEGQVNFSVSLHDDMDGIIGLRFEVSDTGIGIEPEAQTRIFDSFSQADSTTTRIYGGSGLGLSICKQLVEAMDGEIGVDSQPGCGSTFWFTVQLARVGQLQMASLIMPQGAWQVLVVDDSAVDQGVVCGLLRAYGLDVEMVANGKQALEALSRKKYDLVLMDCEMPGMDGYETTRRIRENETAGSRTLIIALTANAMRGDRERCLQAGMDDYLVKPVRWQVLQAVVTHWLSAGHERESRSVSADIGHSA